MTREEFEEATQTGPQAIIRELMEAGQYENAFDLAADSTSGPEMLDYLRQYYNDIPAGLRFNLILECYVFDSHNFPHSMIMELEKFRRADYLKDLPTDEDPVTVFRAGTENIVEATYAISWTIDKDIARQFYVSQFLTPGLQPPRKYFYRGRIHRENILAYTDQRQEREILQYGSVFSIERIPSGIYSREDAEEFLKEYSCRKRTQCV